MNKIVFIAPLVASAILLVIPFAIYSGNYIMYVPSDSMYPTLKPNDLLVVKKTSIDEVKEGDIIAFDSHAEGIGVIAHRVILVTEVDDKVGIDTQGDHNDYHDPWTIYEEDLIGILDEVNPSSGILLSNYFRYPLVAIVVVSAALLIRESIPKKGLEVERLICKRCSYSWFPRIIDGKIKIPDTCPNKNCRSPYWQTSRRTD